MGNQIPFAGGMGVGSGMMPQGHQYTMPGQSSLREFGRDFLTGEQNQGPFSGAPQGNFGFQGFGGLDLDGYQQNPQVAAARAQQSQMNATIQPGIISAGQMPGEKP